MTRAAAVAHDARLAAALEQREYRERLQGLSSIVEPENAVREARNVIMLGEELNDLRYRSSVPTAWVQAQRLLDHYRRERPSLL